MLSTSLAASSPTLTTYATEECRRTSGDRTAAAGDVAWKALVDLSKK